MWSMRPLALLFLAAGCSPQTPQEPTPQQAAYVGCYAFEALSDSLQASLEGGLGDSLPGHFTIRLIASPIPKENNPDKKAIFLADWEYLKDIGITAWMAKSDTVV